MLKLFAHLSDYLSAKNLNHNNYTIVVRCADEIAKDRLKHQVELEFAQLMMRAPVDYPPTRCDDGGTCYGIKFEITT
jgi:hypothetical protein